MSQTTVIAVANNKGGVAKTTSAGNLAYGLSRTLIQEDKFTGAVLMVDLDPQGHLADMFGVRGRVAGRCIGNVLNNPTTLKENMISVDRSDEGLPRRNLFLIPATRNLELVTEELVLRQVSRLHAGFKLATVLQDALAPVLPKFRYVVLDCPPKLDVLKRAVYNLTDYIVVPCKVDYQSFQGAQEHIEDLNALIQEDSDHVIKARLRWVVPTMHPGSQVLANKVLEDMVSLYGRNYVTEPVPERVVVKEAPSFGRTIFEYALRSEPAVAYADLVKRVANVR